MLRFKVRRQDSYLGKSFPFRLYQTLGTAQALTQRIKRLELDADRTLSSNTGFWNAWNLTFMFPMPRHCTMTILLTQ